MAADLHPLKRKSTGLLPAHVELIKLLAAVAVEVVLCESEASSTRSR